VLSCWFCWCNRSVHRWGTVCPFSFLDALPVCFVSIWIVELNHVSGLCGGKRSIWQSLFPSGGVKGWRLNGPVCSSGIAANLRSRFDARNCIKGVGTVFFVSSLFILLVLFCGGGSFLGLFEPKWVTAYRPWSMADGSADGGGNNRENVSKPCVGAMLIVFRGLVACAWARPSGAPRGDAG
jgi:hypothetical protein